MTTSDPRASAAGDPAANNPEPGAGDDPLARIGQVIDERYRILEFIGQGGMGSVFRAEHVTIRRPVAVKLLHRSLASVPELGRRFEREAFAIGRIDHPNCVNVSDFGKLEDGSLFLVMEYLEGESVGDLLDREARVAPERSLHILRHVLRGLRHAHRKDIVHRDVKPENVVLVEHDGDPDFAKVLDFGIAKLVGRAETEDGGEKLTQAGIAFGTPAYLSPEQAVGEPADPRSDLYSATVVLYEMLTGRPPFSSEDKLELLAMHTSREAPRLAEVAPEIGVSPELEALVQKGLAKRKADRFADADDYIAAIDELLPGPPARAPSSLPYRADSEPAIPPPPGSSPPVPHAQTPPPLTRDPTDLRIRSGARTKLVGFASLVMVALLTLVIFLTRDGASTEPSISRLLPGADNEEEEVVKEAEEKLAGGDPDQSLEVLEQKAADLADNAEAQLQLGHTLATKSEYAKALLAYLRAVELDPDHATDPKMQANLKLMIDEEGVNFPVAARLLYEHPPDPVTKAEAQERLLEASVGHDPERRREAFAILEELGLGDKIDRVAAFGLDLRQGETCEARREAVAKLRALDDRRAIPALKRARWRRGARRRNANRCLKQHAEDAIKYLESLPDKGGAEAAEKG